LVGQYTGQNQSSIDSYETPAKSFQGESFEDFFDENLLDQQQHQLGQDLKPDRYFFEN
jgi:hypothetical protein